MPKKESRGRPRAKKKAAAAPAQRRKSKIHPTIKVVVPARPTPQKGKVRVHAEALDPTPPPVMPPAETGVTVSHELPADLPIFHRWFVRERTRDSEATGKTKHLAFLYFDESLVYTLEGPDSGKKLQHQADQWNAQEYIPKLDVHPGYFRVRPPADSFLWDGKNERPFVK